MPLLPAALWLLAAGGPSAAPSREPAGGAPDGSACEGVERARFMMGTTARVLICDPLPEELAAAAAGAALDEMDEVDRLMSLYKPDSDLSRLNREGQAGPVAVDLSLIELLAVSRELSLETGGLFDVTVKPLMDHYGFYAGLGFAPPEGGLPGALGRVGFEGLDPDPAAGTVSFSRAGMGVDLGGVAKGYALDRAAEALLRRGVGRAVLDLGRNIRLIGRGPRPDGLWQVAVADPLDAAGLAGCLAVPEGALSTSAVFAAGGEGGDSGAAHVLHPRKGKVIRRPLQATVWSPSATRADALSTALLLAGPREARRILEKRGDTAVRLLSGRSGGVGYGLEEIGGIRLASCSD